jgi:hypothetical protein
MIPKPICKYWIPFCSSDYSQITTNSNSRTRISNDLEISSTKSLSKRLSKVQDFLVPAFETDTWPSKTIFPRAGHSATPSSFSVCELWLVVPKIRLPLRVVKRSRRPSRPSKHASCLFQEGRKLTDTLQTGARSCDSPSYLRLCQRK